MLDTEVSVQRVSGFENFTALRAGISVWRVEVFGLNVVSNVSGF